MVNEGLYNMETVPGKKMAVTAVEETKEADKPDEPDKPDG